MTTKRDPATTGIKRDRTIVEKYGLSYAEQKSWSDDRFGSLTSRERADLKALMRKAGKIPPPHSRVLEIGFGKGGFLAHGKSELWEMQGLEASDLLVQRARKRGFDAIWADNLKPFADDSFDLVVAIDVLEHIGREAIHGFLADVKRILKDKGVFIARFPNGDSPFGRFSQHGDPTHLTTIGSGMARSLAAEAGLEIIYIGGEAHPIWAGASYFAYRLVANPIKLLINLGLNLLFCPGAPRSLCSTNLAMIVRANKVRDKKDD